MFHSRFYAGNSLLRSPWLFFLCDSDLLDLLSVSYHNIRAIEVFLAKIFPWFGSLIVLEGTEAVVTKRGYNPEILGLVSSDGETFAFEQPLKARLEVDHWVKRIALSVKHGLRHHLITFFSDYGAAWGDGEGVARAWSQRGPDASRTLPVQGRREERG